MLGWLASLPSTCPHPQLRGPFVWRPELPNRVGGRPGEWPAGAAFRPPRPGGRLRCQRQKRFLPAPAGPEVQAAPPSPVCYLRYAAPRILGVSIWGHVGSGRCWGSRSWMILCHGAGPCWNFICPALGPNEVVVWAIRELPGTIHSSRTWGPALALAGEWPAKMPLSWCFVVVTEDQFCWELLFSLESDIFQMVWTCPCVGHYHTKRPIKIKKNKKQKTVAGGGKWCIYCLQDS